MNVPGMIQFSWKSGPNFSATRTNLCFPNHAAYNTTSKRTVAINKQTWEHPSAYLRQRQAHLIPWTLVASTKSDQGFESGFPDWSCSWCPPDRSQNVSLSHLADCRENRPVTVWEMLINLLKCPSLQWWGNWISDPESVSGTGSPPNVNRFVPLVAPIIRKDTSVARFLRDR